MSQLPFQFGVSDEDATEVVSIFKRAGANLSVRAKKMFSSETPLHVACTYGNLAVVKALVEGGALTNIMDDRGRLPIDNAKKALGNTILSSKPNPQACIDYLEVKAKSDGVSGNNILRNS